MENTQTEPKEQLLTVQEVADLLRLSTAAVRNLILKEEIPALRVGKQYRIPRYVIDNLMCPLLGKTPEELGFGMWKKHPIDGVHYVNAIRKKDEGKTLDQILQELAQWERTFSSTRTS